MWMFIGSYFPSLSDLQFDWLKNSENNKNICACQLLVSLLADL